MKACVITFPGSNCDHDVIFALRKFNFDVDNLWYQDSFPSDRYDLVVLPGGFSFGDYLRSGAIASLSPILDSVKESAEKGKFIVGICNGFQILCEAHLLPGALAKNHHLKFVCDDVQIRVCSNNSFFTLRLLPDQKINLPIAHGDGRYTASPEVLQQLKDNDQILLAYDGVNPNGSLENIAGICNSNRNVVGLMPHPERAVHLRKQDGRFIFESIIESLKKNHGY